MSLPSNTDFACIDLNLAVCQLGLKLCQHFFSIVGTQSIFEHFRYAESIFQHFRWNLDIPHYTVNLNKCNGYHCECIMVTYC